MMRTSSYKTVGNLLQEAKKPHIDNLCQICKVKVLRVAVVFEDRVASKKEKE